MGSVTGAFQVVAAILVMILLGMFLTRIGWIDDKVSKFISQFVVKVALPASVLNSMLSKFDKAGLIGMGAGVLIPVIAILLALLIGSGLASLLKIPRNRRGAFVCMFAFSNSVFIGVPVCEAVFGAEAKVDALIYYIANTALFWTIGYSLMSRDGDNGNEVRSYRMIPAYLRAKDKQSEKYIPARNAVNRLKKLIPIPIIFLIISVILILAGVKLPESGIVMTASKYIGGTVTPMSLLFIGYALMKIFEKRDFHYRKGYLTIIIGKFILVPGVVVLLMLLFTGIPSMNEILTPILRGTLVLEAAMPVMTQTTIVENSCGGDSEYTATCTAITTIMSFAVIPLYMLVINVIV